MQTQILSVGDVAERIGTSVATVNRYLAQRRKGIGSFPLPISPFKGKGRWRADDVDRYIESLSAVNTSAVPVSVKSEEQKAKEFKERQKRAQATLAQHGIKRGGV
jgi:predicted DNA-binding transcriptional regulator AlpA